jgi:hypothetical protein
MEYLILLLPLSRVSVERVSLCDLEPILMLELLKLAVFNVSTKLEDELDIRLFRPRNLGDE